jgi:hypothetical protein
MYSGIDADSCIIFDYGNWVIVGGDGDLAGELVDPADFADLTLEESGDAGDWGEFADLAVVDGADFSVNAEQGSIIIVGGLVGVVMEDGSILVPVDPPGSDPMREQLELLMAADLDDSDADDVAAEQEVSAGDDEATGEGPDSGAVQETGGDTEPVPARPVEERPLRASRRGRAR